jgi:hypothetical protein
MQIVWAFFSHKLLKQLFCKVGSFEEVMAGSSVLQLYAGYAFWASNFKTARQAEVDRL